MMHLPYQFVDLHRILHFLYQFATQGLPRGLSLFYLPAGKLPVAGRIGVPGGTALHTQYLAVVYHSGSDDLQFRDEGHGHKVILEHEDVPEGFAY